MDHLGGSRQGPQPPASPALRRSGGTGFVSSLQAGWSTGHARPFAAAEFSGRVRRRLIGANFGSFASGWKPKAHSLRCSSSPICTHCAGAQIEINVMAGLSLHTASLLTDIQFQTETVIRRSPPIVQDSCGAGLSEKRQRHPARCLNRNSVETSPDANGKTAPI